MKFGRSLENSGVIIPTLLVALLCFGCTRSPEAKSAAYIEAGKKLLLKNDPTRAILQFQNAVKATPKNSEAYYQLSVALLASGDLVRGIGGLRKVLELNPKHAQAQLQLAQLMAGANDVKFVKDAQQRLQALLQDAPENADALHTLALTELKLGNPEEAVQHLEQALLAAPQGVMIAVTLAQAKLRQNDAQGAEDVLKRACENSPKSADAVVILGRFYLSQNRIAEAQQQFQRALVMDPANSASLLSLATLQDRLGHKQDAEQNFKRLANLPDKTFKAVYANFLFHEGRRDEAIREFERLVKADPQDRQVRNQLVTAYRIGNRAADAEKILNDALNKNPKDVDAQLQRAEMFLAAGKYESAEADLNDVIRFQPNSAEAQYVMAKFHLARGEALSYRQALSKSLELDPRLLPVRLELAHALIAANSAKGALDLLNEAPEFQKRLPALLIQRNWTLWALGDMAQMRAGIDLGLSQLRSADLLLQDGVWKLAASNFSGARAALEEALKLDPTDVRALGALTQSYQIQKEGPTALKRVKEYASQHPNAAPVQEFLGLVSLAQGDRKQARTAFMAAKAADSQFLQADLSLVQLDVLEGKWDDGASRLNSILASNPRSAIANLWLGEVETVKGNQSSAINHFRKALEANPDNAQSLNNLAYLLADYSKQTDQALKYAERAEELAPDNPNYADTMGWILYQKGLYRAAITHLERAASKEGNAAWQYHLAMAYAKAGDEKKARATLQVALKRDPTNSDARIASELVGEPK